jgi:Flp pilus assembly protein TadG
MKHSISKFPRRRRGAIAVLAAVFLVMLVGMIAFAVDIGYLAVVNTQLQAAADSAALAAAGSSNLSQSGMVTVAQQFANANNAAGRAIQLSASDVQFGTWDTSTRTFTPSATAATAVKVTTRTGSGSGGATSLFFGRIFGLSSLNQQASAVAAVNPRDIAFVIDTSGSMNDDTTPGDSSSSTSLMQTVYNEFGFGTYPGSTAAIKSGKTTSWIMSNTLPSVMPNAIPVPNTSNSNSVSYWGSYITYCKNNGEQLGYQSYLQFMMYNGWDVKPDGTNYTPLSLNSNLCACPLHSETVGGVSFSFPPDEMPTHAARSALIAALQVVQTQNQNITDPNQMDWVSVVSFDTSPKIQQTLTSNYSAAMTACTKLQACSDDELCTNTEAGLNTAYNLIKPQSQGGQGREHTNKIVVLLTDGQPNLKLSSSTTINNYISANPANYTNPSTGQTTSDWYTSGTYKDDQNGALMQTSIMQGNSWYLYAVGVGLGCDYTFMDNMARMGNTANNNGQAPRGSGDPSVYQAVLTQLFNNIVTNPKLRLVQ